MPTHESQGSMATIIRCTCRGYKAVLRGHARQSRQRNVCAAPSIQWNIEHERDRNRVVSAWVRRGLPHTALGEEPCTANEHGLDLFFYQEGAACVVRVQVGNTPITVSSLRLGGELCRRCHPH